MHTVTIMVHALHTKVFVFYPFYGIINIRTFNIRIIRIRVIINIGDIKSGRIAFEQCMGAIGMARTIGIGIQSFEKLITENGFYIDKTDFIRQWWENRDEVQALIDSVAS